MESKDKLIETDIKNFTFYYFDDIMRVVDVNLDYILLDEKSCENILIYGISFKTFMGEINHCILDLIKLIDLLKLMMELDIFYNLVLGGMMQFIIGLEKGLHEVSYTHFC